ncbi:MAG: GNAT family N-acetyltransferase [Clostridioides sp.]|jgi:predicted acetyltransferase|nr:GNAT family N-acetyltransferase [Clostridioides sp.]
MIKARLATEKDLKDVRKIWDYCFNDPEEYADYYFQKRYKPNNNVVVELDGEIVSSVQLSPFKMKLGENEYDASYVIGVSTLPEARSKGCMKEMLTYSLNELYARNIYISILMPIDYRIYKRYGYENCYDLMRYEISTNDLKNFKQTGDFKKIDFAKEVDNQEIEELICFVRKYQENLNADNIRDERYFERVFDALSLKCFKNNFYILKEDENKSIENKNSSGCKKNKDCNEYTKNSTKQNVYTEESGEVKNNIKGYIIYSIDDGVMNVSELVYNSPTSLKSLLGFIYNHNTQCKIVKIKAPVNNKIRFVLDNPLDAKMSIAHFMTGRIINVVEFFKTLKPNFNLKSNTKYSDVELGVANFGVKSNTDYKYKKEHSIILKVKDNQIEANNKTFEITIQDESISVEIANKNAEIDIELSINQLSQIGFSYLSVEEVISYCEVYIKEDRKNDVVEFFNLLFKKRINYIEDYD